MTKKELLDSAEKYRYSLNQMVSYKVKKEEENRRFSGKYGTKFDLTRYHEENSKRTYSKLISTLDDYIKNLVGVKTTGDDILENDLITLLEFKKRVKTPSKSEDKLQLMKELIEFIELMPTLNQATRSTEKALNLDIRTLNLPLSIRSEIALDFNELTRCFNNGLFRSSLILCGRILEVSLHRKYYEVTGVDLLEKAPGIGLGTMIQKLHEKGFMLEPGLSQQVHLVNQVRIASVHKKMTLFTPSREQAYATILFTLDTIKKLFREEPGRK